MSVDLRVSDEQFAILESDAFTDPTHDLLYSLYKPEEWQQIWQQVYNPLQVWETRLLILHPGGPNEILRADLKTAIITYHEGLGVPSKSGNRFEGYEALSYAWGDTTLTHPLVCNGFLVGITRNLYHALRHLRRDEPRSLWVDAICINQKNDEEKARQISILRDIFRKASQVIAWISETSIDWPPGFMSMDDTQSLPWLRRAWIVQECVAAQSIVVHAGHKRIDWDDFVTRTKSINAVAFLTDAIDSSKGANGRQEASMQTAKELYQLLAKFRHLEASDDRDRIFALLGLTRVSRFYGRANKHPVDGIHVDYSKTTAEVYAEVTRFLYHWLLPFRVLLSTEAGSSDLPSWCFELRAKALPALHTRQELTNMVLPLVQASSNRTATSLSRPLVVSGFHIATLLTPNLGKSDDSCDTSVASGELSDFVEEWMLEKIRQREKWRDMTRREVVHFHRNRNGFKRTIQSKFSKARHNFTAPTTETVMMSIAQNTWRVQGRPKAGDIVVYPKGAVYPSTLRVEPTTGGYRYVGRGTPESFPIPRPLVSDKKAKPPPNPLEAVRGLLDRNAWSTNQVHPSDEVKYAIY